MTPNIHGQFVDYQNPKILNEYIFPGVTVLKIVFLPTYMYDFMINREA